MALMNSFCRSDRPVPLSTIVYFALVIFIYALSPGAVAQVRLPNVQIPQLPGVQLPIDPNDTLEKTTSRLDARPLQDVRRIRIRELLRTNRRALEADPNGEPVVRNEIIAYSPSEASLQIASNLGLTVIRQRSLPGLDINVVVLAPRAGASTRASLRRLQRADPTANYDFNHVYLESGVQDGPIIANEKAVKAQGFNLRVGLIDTGVDNSQPSLDKAEVRRWGCDDRAVPAFHGTAVASLLIGNASNFSGAAPAAALYAADVYCAKPTGGAAEVIAAAFAWLAQEKVAVINVSLVGPANALLARVIAAMLARGHVIVAAVGNDGPAAPPLYPASYPGVIGVTGVDEWRRALLEAAQGMQVDFAAPGANMAAANVNGGYVGVRGTSFAAPIVAGLLAQRVAIPDVAHAKQAVDELVSQAIDLGLRGADKIYGQGLVGENVRVSPLAVANRAKN